MRFAGSVVCMFAVATGGCATRSTPPANVPAPRRRRPARSRACGTRSAARRSARAIGAGDTRIEKQEWHLTQAGGAISGYYIAALTFVSGDGRPYVCSRQPRVLRRPSGSTSPGASHGGQIEIEEIEQRAAEEGTAATRAEARSRATAAASMATS